MPRDYPLSAHHRFGLFRNGPAWATAAKRREAALTSRTSVGRRERTCFGGAMRPRIIGTIGGHARLANRRRSPRRASAACWPATWPPAGTCARPCRTPWRRRSPTFRDRRQRGDLYGCVVRQLAVKASESIRLPAQFLRARPASSLRVAISEAVRYPFRTSGSLAPLGSGVRIRPGSANPSTYPVRVPWVAKCTIT
jgi:hypothetical protein